MKFPSFPRRRESMQRIQRLMITTAVVDSRLRGNDGWTSMALK
jgi:hypothetical protein